MNRIRVNKKSYFIVWVRSEFCFGAVSLRGFCSVLKGLDASPPRVSWDVALLPVGRGLGRQSGAVPCRGTVVSYLTSLNLCSRLSHGLDLANLQRGLRSETKHPGRPKRTQGQWL